MNHGLARAGSDARGLPRHHRAAAVTGHLGKPPAGLPLTVYTDGSVSLRQIARRRGWLTGWGYLSTGGSYGCGRYPQFAANAGNEVTTVTELRAVWHAIRADLTTRPVTIVTDSRNAAAILERWKAGSERMPAGYIGSNSGVATLDKLRRLVTANPAHLTVETVRGHSGDILNEGADTLAQLGMRWARDNLTKDDVHQRAERVAEGFLTQWRS
uniref:RNase H family protein n=1 Tax=Paractinoplanes polyasparticus TaxID=2856853 RepID=UPI001C857AD0|nr:RNase H family protein [Actinoplanes polyasparticus]